jgi:3-oxoacyl-[acyl-carrier-protein] synthase II
MNEPEDEFKNVNFVPNKSQKWPENGKKRIAVKNSFGFGGTNVSLIVSEFVN